jgi:hypothetical protein
MKLSAVLLADKPITLYFRHVDRCNVYKMEALKKIIAASWTYALELGFAKKLSWP